MTGQLALDFTIARARARNADPATSHDAANRADPGDIHARKVLSVLRACYPGGATYEEIDRLANLPQHEAARRLPELRKRGLAEPTEVLRKTSSGRSARVWRIATHPR